MKFSLKTNQAKFFLKKLKSFLKNQKINKMIKVKKK